MAVYEKVESADRNHPSIEEASPPLVKDYQPSRKCLIIGNVVSVALILLQILCVVLTIDSIKNLMDSESSTPANSGYQRQAKLPTVPCNKSSPCSVVADDTYTKLVTIFTGVKRQSLIRSKSNGISQYHTWQECEQFSLLNCSHGSLTWASNIYGSQGATKEPITIKDNATYGIHSLFTFKYPHGNIDSTYEATHRIHIVRDSHPGYEIKFEKKVVLNQETDVFKTSTIFDFVYLHAGDRVYPSLSDTSFLFKMQKANEWGIFPIR